MDSPARQTLAELLTRLRQQHFHTITRAPERTTNERPDDD